jgi:hypothetical protein
MTSMDSDEHDRRADHDRHPDGPDPVHPGASERPREHTAPPANAELPDTAEPPNNTAVDVQADPNAQAHHTQPPLATDLGAPAILEHRLVALEIGSAVSPVAIHRWTGRQVGTILLTPTQAQVWARAGRLTLATAEGHEHRLTVLAPDEAAAAALGAHWPLGEPDGRVKRIAFAAAHDVGDLLTFPAWLARTAHLSGERNQQLARLVNRIRTASPGTVVHYGQTFGHLHAQPGQQHPYDHRGLVGHEGWPREL